jgi:hypothetical protein
MISSPAHHFTCPRGGEVNRSRDGASRDATLAARRTAGLDTRLIGNAGLAQR